MARYNGYGNNLYEDETGQIRPRVSQVIDARAPMHDPTTNAPMSGPSGTPSAIWASIFKNTPGSTYISSFQSPATNPVATAPAPSQIAAGATGTQAPLPPLSQTASGVNHAQAWNQGIHSPASLNSFSDTAAAGQLAVAPYVQPGTTTMTRFAGPSPTPAPTVTPVPPDQNQDYRRFSWSSAFGY